jgi:hypothetical protein
MAVVLVLGAYITVIVGVQTWTGQATADGTVAIIALSIMVVLGTCAFAWQHHKFAHHARYAEAQAILMHLMHELVLVGIRSLAAPDDVARALEKTLDRLVNAFSLITATRCSACVKANCPTEGAVVGVYTLCRDGTSERRDSQALSERDIDRMQGMPIPSDSRIDRNTDFQHIVENKIGTARAYFFSNNLPGLADYRNSSFDVYGKPRKWFRAATWPLPYKSTIVVPIASRSLVEPKPHFHGFLCLDSPHRDVFEEHIDVDILRAVAGSISPLLSRYGKLVGRNDAQEER